MMVRAGRSFKKCGHAYPCPNHGDDPFAPLTLAAARGAAGTCETCGKPVVTDFAAWFYGSDDTLEDICQCAAHPEPTALHPCAFCEQEPRDRAHCARYCPEVRKPAPLSPPAARGAEATTCGAETRWRRRAVFCIRPSGHDGHHEYGLDKHTIRAAHPEPTPDALRSAAKAMLNLYVALVNSGDAGFWDAETEPDEVIALRAALAQEEGR